mmetsp:Transcript_64397/g.179034  ORF Transcript_64397/g.179034 Transcript_64397/m.179034 type:complete len:208 (-) Transcript_64397:617-1240(-)
MIEADGLVPKVRQLRETVQRLETCLPDEALLLRVALVATCPQNAHMVNTPHASDDPIKAHALQAVFGRVTRHLEDHQGSPQRRIVLSDHLRKPLGLAEQQLRHWKAEVVRKTLLWQSGGSRQGRPCHVAWVTHAVLHSNAAPHTATGETQVVVLRPCNRDRALVSVRAGCLDLLELQDAAQQPAKVRRRRPTNVDRQRAFAMPWPVN